MLEQKLSSEKRRDDDDHERIAKNSVLFCFIFYFLYIYDHEIIKNQWRWSASWGKSRFLGSFNWVFYDPRRCLLSMSERKKKKQATKQWTKFMLFFKSHRRFFLRCRWKLRVHWTAPFRFFMILWSRFLCCFRSNAALFVVCISKKPKTQIFLFSLQGYCSMLANRLAKNIAERK